MIKRELNLSAYMNYINGNYSDITNEERILSAHVHNSLEVNIINDNESED